MKGIIHEVYETDRKGKLGVGLCNQKDCFYECEFETREEVNEFIKELIKARDAVFGNKNKG